MSLARALLLKGKTEEAERWIKDAIENTHFGANDYKGNGPYYYVLGRIEEKKGERENALRSYIMSLIEGDVYNKWTPQSDSVLKDLYRKIDKNEKKLEIFIRDEMDYSGIIFEDVTEKMG